MLPKKLTNKRNDKYIFTSILIKLNTLVKKLIINTLIQKILHIYGRILYLNIIELNKEKNYFNKNSLFTI